MSGISLLEAAVGYLMAAVTRTAPLLLDAPTPCREWDLRLLLRHVADSMAVLADAMTAGAIGPAPGPDHDRPQADPLRVVRCRAAGLLTACADASCAERVVIIGDRELPASLTAVAGALEVAVHGWDIAAACGRTEPIPPMLAALLLPVAPVLITPASRPGLFADPVSLVTPCGPGDELVAFTGRRPHAASC